MLVPTAVALIFQVSSVGNWWYTRTVVLPVVPYSSECLPACMHACMATTPAGERERENTTMEDDSTNTMSASSHRTATGSTGTSRSSPPTQQHTPLNHHRGRSRSVMTGTGGSPMGTTGTNSRNRTSTGSTAAATPQRRIVPTPHHNKAVTKDEAAYEEDHDRLGRRILELLLSFQPQEQPQQHRRRCRHYSCCHHSNAIPMHFQWTKPILCRHNWNVLRQQSWRIRWCHCRITTRASSSSSSVPASSTWYQTIQHAMGRDASITTTKQIYHALLLFLLSIGGTTTLSSVLFSGTILLTILALSILWLFTVDLLFDVPRHVTIQRGITMLRYGYFIILDQYLFQGWRYRGRNTRWNHHIPIPSNHPA